MTYEPWHVKKEIRMRGIFSHMLPFVLFLLYVSPLFIPVLEHASMPGQRKSDVTILAGFEAQESLERNKYSAQSHRK